MTDPSSITSVTEEDSDESDTTETSYSKTADSVSSVLYSSECNTDDKLSNSLTNFSISKNSNHLSSKKRQRKHENDLLDSATSTDTFTSRYRPSPLPSDSAKHKVTQAKKKQKNFHSSALTRYVLQKQLIHKTLPSSLPKQEEENFGVDDPNNCLYTDFSDTSSIPPVSEDDDEDDIESNNCRDFQSDDNNSNSNGQCQFLPNMNSSSWFQARCFDRYWSHYNFVMEWYRQHVEAVNMLSAQFAWPYSDMWHQTHQPKPKKKNKVKRAKNRARNRRLAKARLRASQVEVDKESGTTQDSDSNVDENELEMEITDDMMDFFEKSFKHRMERDQDKNIGDADSKANEEMAKTGGPPNLKAMMMSGPKEQPGIRRTAEMKTLYGQGAAMIHGMETALQMTYDKVLDRHKPKLWPNMPLKIVFAKSK